MRNLHANAAVNRRACRDIILHHRIPQCLYRCANVSRPVVGKPAIFWIIHFSLFSHSGNAPPTGQTWANCFWIYGANQLLDEIFCTQKRRVVPRIRNCFIMTHRPARSRRQYRLACNGFDSPADNHPKINSGDIFRRDLGFGSHPGNTQR